MIWKHKYSGSGTSGIRSVYYVASPTNYSLLDQASLTFFYYDIGTVFFSVSLSMSFSTIMFLFPFFSLSHFLLNLSLLSISLSPYLSVCLSLSFSPSLTLRYIFLDWTRSDTLIWKIRCITKQYWKGLLLLYALKIVKYFWFLHQQM